MFIIQYINKSNETWILLFMISNGEWKKHPWFNVLPLTFLPLSSSCCPFKYPFKHVCMFLWIGKSFAHINLLVFVCVLV